MAREMELFDLTLQTLHVMQELESFTRSDLLAHMMTVGRDAPEWVNEITWKNLILNLTTWVSSHGYVIVTQTRGKHNSKANLYTWASDRVRQQCPFCGTIVRRTGDR